MENIVEMMNINDFPDEILTHLLSFLPFKQAFRTTILSKRWRPLPRSLAVLDIDDYSVNDINDWFRFRQFMNTVIFSPHSQHLPLTSFNLNCHSRHVLRESNYSTFDQWIKAAKQRHVKLISLFFSSMVPMAVPMAASTIFCCKTLVVLKLMNVIVANMPCCSVDLPLLKELYLSKVRFSDMDDLIRLVYGCPILEILTTTYVETSNGVTVGGGYLKPLSNLIKACIHLFHVPFRILCNVQSLTIFKVEMLKILHNEEISSYYKSFPVFGNLTILHLCWRFEPEVIHDWDEVVKMLQNCPKLQTLKIVKMGKMQISSYYNFPVFGNLTSLHLSWWYELEGIHIHDWDEVVKMLQNCPKLQILKIVKGGMSTTKEGWKNPCLIPECVSSNLRTCKIESYKAVKGDFRFAAYIMQNARLLQVMTICRDQDSIGSPQFFEDLSYCPRISPACKLDLSSW